MDLSHNIPFRILDGRDAGIYQFRLRDATKLCTSLKRAAFFKKCGKRFVRAFAPGLKHVGVSQNA